MPKTLDPFRFLLVAVAGWMNQQQQHAIEYLREEILCRATNAAAPVNRRTERAYFPSASINCRMAPEFQLA
jgi:hypothetical protein